MMLLAAVALVATAAATDVLSNAAAATPPELHASDFHATVSKAVAGGQPFFVFFHSPQCGHCHAMRPAWDELSRALRPTVLEDVVFGESEKMWSSGMPRAPARLATVDATENKALADGLQVHGYPTLLSFEPGGDVYEYEGDRSFSSLLEFASRDKHLFHDAKGRRGFLAADGTVRPLSFDLLLRAPTDASEIINFAFDQSRVAAVLLAAFWGLLGACFAVAYGHARLGQSSPPQFVVVECPPAISPGDTFSVELVPSAPSTARRWLGRLGFRKRSGVRVIDVAAPAGISPGQTFFVPLVAPPAVRVRSSSDGGKSKSKKPKAA